MTASDTLTAELRAEVDALVVDLRERLVDVPGAQAAWEEEHRQAVASFRTASSWTQWSDERLVQVAVAWVLATVFVRFCEDNALLTPVWFVAPGRRQEALDAYAVFIRERVQAGDDVTDREWILDAVHHLRSVRATSALVDDSSPIWLLSPSGDAATRLIAFWRARDDNDELLRDLRDPTFDTRFLGDIYQNLSKAARDQYALLQTPIFVEEFILDRTLEPALADRPLEGFKLIDPTCGSGHFLLGAFARFLDRWRRAAPAMDERTLVQTALDSVYGVDLNPFAVAISRFRLTVAALQATGETSLEQAPGYRYHLAVGDSLLHGAAQGELDLGPAAQHDKVAADFAYATENLAELRRILEPHRYDCVVGNPPYIAVRDKEDNANYRALYSTCSGRFVLTVPFMERFFQLARGGERPGWVGQITSNSFTKREFGSKLIEEFLPRQDLRLIADMSGAFIPGHGTPTVIIVGRPGSRGRTADVRAVLSIRGEPGRPDDAAKGKVWASIAEHIDEPGWSNEWVSVADLPRQRFSTHPWSLAGGSAPDLLIALDLGRGRKLSNAAISVGITSFTLEDEVFVSSAHSFSTQHVTSPLREMVLGESVRDWGYGGTSVAIFPYDEKIRPIRLSSGATFQFLWRFRTNLANGVLFGGKSKIQSGLAWYEYGRITPRKLLLPLSITFAEVSTHNHFVFDRGGKVFKQTAPVIKLSSTATEDDHLALLGVLNSSTACFWLKQNCFNKGNGGIGGGIGDEPWEPRYQFNGSTVRDLPVPEQFPLTRTKRLDALAQRASLSSPDAICSDGTPSRERLDEARSTWLKRRQQLVFEQEELDWEVYSLYALIDEDLTYSGRDVQQIDLGQRAFEIALARKIAAGDDTSAWFVRHDSAPITELPAEWPQAYRELVQRRMALATEHPFIRLLEQPENKRRWAVEPWEKQEERAVRSWLLDRIEDERFWFDGQGRPTPRSVRHLADEVSRDPELVDVLTLWEGRPDVAVADSLARLLSTEAVPYLAAHRYKESGLRTRAAWEHTWDLQRREDAGETFDPPIAVPPKYKPADFARLEYWSYRGKLDVPKERFVLYPGAERQNDPSAVIGWAGWDHAQQALALALLMFQLEADGAPDAQLIPLVAGLAEQLPWVRQWHHEPEELYGGESPAEYLEAQFAERAAQVGRTLDELKAWRPAPARRGRQPGKKAAARSTVTPRSES